MSGSLRSEEGSHTHWGRHFLTGEGYCDEAGMQHIGMSDKRGEQRNFVDLKLT